MKTGIHPQNYRPVVFQDTNNGTMFLINSCVETSETVKYDDGNEYPVYKVEISSASHPFYTGKKVTIDSAGRIEKFQAKQKLAEQKKDELGSKENKRRRTIEDKVNEALKEEMEKDRKEDEKLKAKIAKRAGKNTGDDDDTTEEEVVAENTSTTEEQPEEEAKEE
jgi:large subunit ribosomal protein L31